MSIEDAISGALAAQLAPLREEIRRLASEVEAMRRALSKTAAPTEDRQAPPASGADETGERFWSDDLEDPGDAG